MRPSPFQDARQRRRDAEVLAYLRWLGTLRCTGFTDDQLAARRVKVRWIDNSTANLGLSKPVEPRAHVASDRARMPYDLDPLQALPTGDLT